MLKSLTPTQSYTKVSKTLLHKHFIFTKPLGHSKGGLVLIQKCKQFNPYQRYKKTFMSSNWAHSIATKILIHLQRPTHLLNFSCKSYRQRIYSYLAKVFRFVYYRKIHLPFKDLEIGIFNQPSKITSPPFPSTPIPPFTRILKFQSTYL